MQEAYHAWGRLTALQHDVLYPRTRQEAAAAIVQPGRWLGGGLRRSYGDVGQNSGNRIIDMRHVDRFIAFDREQGLLDAEAGVSLLDAIAVTVPHGWFPATVPGTQFVTLGGAIANDVHGKNHHRNGTFGTNVESFGLARSDGRILNCSRTENADLFAATIGGLGLTGLITQARLRLAKIGSAWLDVENITFHDLETFLALSRESEAAWEHTVAWFDCMGSKAGRGIFSRANWRNDGNYSAPAARPLSMPIQAPGWILNGLSISAFNALYYRLKKSRAGLQAVHYAPFLFPLDGIRHWNRLYGKAGFYQYQCVIPPAAAPDALKDMLRLIGSRNSGSFLAVLKTFGNVPSPGLLSFPMPGATLALDFPNKGPATLALMQDLDRIVAAAGGRLYPAKDARMPAGLFQSGYPAWQDFSPFMDSQTHSDFWQRVTTKAGDTQ
jgi:L-gulonolactone oxidase